MVMNDDLLNSVAEKNWKKKNPNILKSVQPSVLLFKEPGIAQQEKWYPRSCPWIFSF